VKNLDFLLPKKWKIKKGKDFFHRSRKSNNWKISNFLIFSFLSFLS